MDEDNTVLPAAVLTNNPNLDEISANSTNRFNYKRDFPLSTNYNNSTRLEQIQPSQDSNSDDSFLPLNCHNSNQTPFVDLIDTNKSPSPLSLY